jgi:hypothetical protein
MLVIKAMIDLANPGGSKLNSIIYQIKWTLPQFVHVLFYHIKREMNGEVEHWAKVASSLSPVVLNKNGVLSHCLIPWLI